MPDTTTDLTFVTGNEEKYKIAAHEFIKNDLELCRATFDIDEIQSENSEEIVKDKLTKAYTAAGGPVVVNDDSWAFVGLSGFPGPYMKSILYWLTVDDLLNLTRTVTDRRVVLSQWIGYQDGNTQKLFCLKHAGKLLPEARGNYGNALQKIISMPGDNGLSVAEQYDNGIDPSAREVSQGWRQFIAWYQGSQP